tara:strand:+ start:2378 stop:3448 length:1071 start_codon:yes stop_codon:yes gene_type:complete
MTIIITGGSGFIGSNFIHSWFKDQNEKLINIDCLTYAGNNLNLVKFKNKKNYQFKKLNINEAKKISNLLKKEKPRVIINFAAESHVDRSILSPEIFINTNIVGLFNLLEVTKKYYNSLNNIKKNNFKFIQVSTDEVYGSLKKNEKPFLETSLYKPNSPYAASKASGDHLVRSYRETYKLPTFVTNCSNNYGPYQFLEKLIPLIINNALNEKTIPIYGNGKQIRDWIYVEDHCNALKLITNKKTLKSTFYNVGSNNEQTNLSIVNTICNKLDIIKPRKNNQSYKKLIKFVVDRPGHDFRYAINSNRIIKELNWAPLTSLEKGIDKTINWYLKNNDWIKKTQSKDYNSWIKSNYSKRK